jgi:hypothetical protein
MSVLQMILSLTGSSVRVSHLIPSVEGPGTRVCPFLCFLNYTGDAKSISDYYLCDIKMAYVLILLVQFA